MESTDEKGRRTMTQSKKRLTSGQQVMAGVLGIGQVAFAFLAFWDLAHRDPEAVRGPKPAWIPAILVNWIGPASYFLFGIRR